MLSPRSRSLLLFLFNFFFFFFSFLKSCCNICDLGIRDFFIHSSVWLVEIIQSGSRLILGQTSASPLHLCGGEIYLKKTSSKTWFGCQIVRLFLSFQLYICQRKLVFTTIWIISFLLDFFFSFKACNSSLISSTQLQLIKKLLSIYLNYNSHDNWKITSIKFH